MQKIYLFTFFLLIMCNFAFAQSGTASMNKPSGAWEVGGIIALNSFAGDLVGPDASSLKATRLSIGGFGRLRLSDPLHFRISFSFGRLAASDMDFEDNASRGISFKKNMAELATVMEWEPFSKRLYDANGTFQKSVSPYLFGGLGVLLGRPDLDYENPSVQNSPAVQQDLDNTRSAHFIIPFGMGAKAYLSESLTLGLEYGLRPVFNDYLEGVSMAGNPDANDWYGVFSLMVAKRLIDNH